VVGVFVYERVPDSEVPVLLAVLCCQQCQVEGLGVVNKNIVACIHNYISRIWIAVSLCHCPRNVNIAYLRNCDIDLVVLARVNRKNNFIPAHSAFFQIFSA